MKRKYLFGLGFMALAAAVPLATTTPVLANLQAAGEMLVQQLRRPEVKLVMGAEKQVTEIDQNGQEKRVWKQLEGSVTVQPGDVLRYSVHTENEGEVAAEDLVVTQPVPDQTVYILDSANGNDSAQITYSIDSGETFVEEPMIEVTLPDGTVELRPAPAEVYTHVRWSYDQTIEPEVALNIDYQVQVR